MAITFDRVNKYIEVGAPDTEVTIQELLNAVREYEDETTNLDLPYIANAYGKQDLGGGVLVGITLELLDGWRVKFEDRAGPSYVTCSVTGGNIVAYDEAGSTQFPLVPSTYVFATITSSSSATLQEQESIQYSSFGGGVTIDAASGTAGTTFPAGTPQQPVDSVSDAMSIAVDRGFKKLYVNGDLTFTTGDDVSEMMIVGQDQILSTLTIESAADVTSSKFQDCIITGTLDGGNVIENSRVQTLNYVNGFIWNCVLEEYTVTLGGGAIAHFLDCWSGVPGTGIPTIDMGGSGQYLSVTGYNGDIKLVNKTGSEQATLDINSGKVVIDSTVTAGTVIVRGTCDIEDNSGAGATVNTEGCAALGGEAVYTHTMRNLATKGDVWGK